MRQAWAGVLLRLACCERPVSSRFCGVSLHVYAGCVATAALEGSDVTGSCLEGEAGLGSHPELSADRTGRVTITSQR